MKTLLLVALGFGIVSCGQAPANKQVSPAHTDSLSENIITLESEPETSNNVKSDPSIIYKLSSIQCFTPDSNGTYNQRTVLAAPNYVEFMSFKENSVTFTNFAGSCSYTKQANMKISDNTYGYKDLSLTDITVTPSVEGCNYEKNIIKFDVSENVPSEDIVPLSDNIKNDKIPSSLLYFSSTADGSNLIFNNDFKVKNRPQDVCVNVFTIAN